MERPSKSSLYNLSFTFFSRFEIYSLMSFFTKSRVSSLNLGFKRTSFAFLRAFSKSSAENADRALIVVLPLENFTDIPSC